MKLNLTEKWIVCRICLKQPPETMQNIFDKCDDDDLTQMILECGGVPIKKYDHYPDKICTKCLKYLRVAHKFRAVCQRSYQHLSRFIAPVDVERETGGIIEHTTSSVEVTEIADDAEVGDSDEGHRLSTDDMLEVEEPEEMALKFEPSIALNIKQECGVKEEDDHNDIVDVFEPMDETGDDVVIEAETEIYETVEEINEEDFVELDEMERSGSALLYDVETFDDFVADVSTSDEEFIPNAVKPKRAKKYNTKKMIAAAAAAAATGKSHAQRPTTSRAMKASAIKVKKEPGGKRGPKPKKQTSYICDICGNMYPSQGRLTEHIKLHKGIKPHECEICGHAFAQTQQLARHMNTHTGNRPYKCSYCPAAFADLSTRNKHHRIHTNERPYICDVCGKSFTYTNTLKFHKMIHTGEKPFVCSVCGKGFQQAYKLRNHKMTHEKKGIKLEKIEVETLHNYQEVNAAAATILEI